MLTPIGKRILVKPIEVTQVGKVLIHNAKPSQFMVLAIGDEVTKVSLMDVIYLEKHYGVEVEHEGDKYSVIDEESILAKVANTSSATTDSL